MSPADNRLSLRVDADVHAALAQVEDQRAYVEDLVRTRRREWQAAYLRLSQAGWTGQEMCAACDALNGYGALEALGIGAGAQGIALELHDAQRLTDVCGKWGVDSARWVDRVTSVHDDQALAQALGLIAREFWLGNGEVASRLRGRGGHHDDE
jgi:hypothetical protein